MKKILSLLSIIAIFSSNTLLANAGTACNSKPTSLNLNDLKFYNINVTKNNNHLEINGILAYKNIEDKIIQQYNNIFPDQKITSSNFAINSLKLQNNKSWAIQIYNLNGTSSIKDTKNEELVFPTNYNVLKDNALNIKITTSNPNVTNSKSKNKTSNLVSVTQKGYLNHFIYTNKNLNKGNEVSANIGSSAQSNNLLINNVIDLSDSKYNLNLNQYLNYNSNTNQLSNVFLNLDQNKRKLISNTIVTNLNSQLQQETNQLNTSKQLLIANDNVPLKNALSINNTNTNLFALHYDNNVYALNNSSFPQLGSAWKIFAQIDISNWNYLANSYISAGNNYVYAYLGTVSQNSAKFNLNNISFYNIGGLTLNTQNNEIDIDGANAYQNVINQIVNQNNAFFWSEPSKQINKNMFKIDSTTLNNKSWAIQLTNGTNAIANSKSNLNITDNLNLLSEDNSLNLHIVTNDLNVTNTTSFNNVSVDVPVYLNQFVFNNKDANNNQALTIEDGEISSNVTKDNVIKFVGTGSVYKLNNFQINMNTLGSQIISQLNTNTNKKIISNAIINNVNIAYKKYITNTHLKTLIPEINPLNDTSPDEDVFSISAQTTKIFKRWTKAATEPFFQLRNSSQIGANENVFIQLKISNWTYLTNNNYISLTNTYVLGYLGSTTT